MEQPMDFVFEGVTYKIGRRDFEVEELFRRYLERNALNAIQRHADALSPIDYQGQLDAWRRDCAAEAYDFEGYHAMMALVSRPGQKELAFLTLGVFNPQAKVTKHLVERLYKDKAKWGEFQLIQQAVNADPNATAPSPKLGEGARSGEGANESSDTAKPDADSPKAA